MFTERNRMRRHASMSMIRCGYHDRIDRLAHLVKHLAPVFITLRLRIVLECLIRIMPIDITKCHDVFCAHIFQVTTAHTTDTHTCNIQFITRSRETMRLTQNRSGYNRQTRCCQRS